MAADPMTADEDASLLSHPRVVSAFRIGYLCGNSWARMLWGLSL